VITGAERRGDEPGGASTGPSPIFEKPVTPVTTGDRDPLAFTESVARLLALPLDAFAGAGHGLEIRVLWWPRPLYFVAAENDVAVLAGEGVSRGAIWTAGELADLMAVSGITTAGARTVALAKLTVAGEVAEVRVIAPLPCHVCKGRSWWRSTAGRTVCRTCHPPAPGAEAGG
jgi:hypothetical protein